MAIRVICPHCDSGINAAEKHAGRQVTCPGCNAAFIVPPMGKVALVEPTIQAEIGAFPPAPTTVQNVVTTESTSKRWKLMQLLGVLATMFGAALFMMMVGLADSTSQPGIGAGVAALLLFGGLASYTAGRVCAWWYHG